ncbi:MAG: VWA domain-containing protein [Clostridia bacterium]|nr:VWA domain-containing protein [Clostridia bacterium]
MIYPLGLLALLGIPAIIIIYIIKSQYTEQTVNSTYIWSLSEKFLKRRNPLSGLTGIIALILQILMVILIALAIAQPQLAIGKASRYCFVVDGSASMNMENGESSRFERGINEIKEIIDDAPNGSKYSIIYVSNEATMVLEECEDKELALSQLDTLEPSYTETNYESAMSVAKSYFDNCKVGNAGQDSSDKSTPLVYLVTDKNYDSSKNVTVVNVSNNENNYSITNFECSLDGSTLNIKGQLNAYLGNAVLKLKIYQANGEAEALVLEKSYDVGKYNAETKEGFLLEEKITVEELSYSSIRAVIENEDAYKNDNEAIVYNVKNEQQYSTLVVSETPFFFRAAIDAHGDYKITYVTPEEYEDSYINNSYGLYIFDTYTPNELPKSGTVWMINSNKSVENSGFGYYSSVTLSAPEVMKKTTASDSAIADKLVGVGEKNNDLYLTGYQRYSIYGDYLTLYSHEGSPLIMFGSNSYGNRMVVFAFSLHDSNLVLTGDYVNLVGNLLDYSFPEVIAKTDYVAGESATVNTIANTESIKVTTPLNNEKYLDTTKTENSLILTEAGTYKIEVSDGNNTVEHKIFVSTPEGESIPNLNGGAFDIAGEPVESTRKGVYNPLIIIFIALAIIFAADWMVFMYEKRQLR